MSRIYSCAFSKTPSDNLHTPHKTFHQQFSASMFLRTPVGLIVGVVIAGIIIIAAIIAIVMYLRKQMIRSEENKLRLTARMSGLEESEVRNAF